MEKHTAAVRPGRGGWRGGGRPAVADDERAKARGLRATDKEWAALLAAGGGALVRELGALLAAGDVRALTVWAEELAKKIKK